MGGREAAWRTLWYQPADIRMNNLTQTPIPLLTVIRFDCVCTTGECWGRAGDWVLITLSFITLPSTCSWWEDRLDCNLATTGFITHMLRIYMDDWLLMYCSVPQNAVTDWYRNCHVFHKEHVLLSCCIFNNIIQNDVANLFFFVILYKKCQNSGWYVGISHDCFQTSCFVWTEDIQLKMI